MATPTKNCELTKAQREGLVERCELHVEDTSYDWQCESDDVHNDTVTYWSDIIRVLGFNDRADKLDRDFKLTS